MKIFKQLAKYFPKHLSKIFQKIWQKRQKICQIFQIWNPCSIPIPYSGEDGTPPRPGFGISKTNIPPSFGDDHFGAKLMKLRPQFGTFQMTTDTRQDVILVISQIGWTRTCQAFLHDSITSVFWKEDVSMHIISGWDWMSSYRYFKWSCIDTVVFSTKFWLFLGKSIQWNYTKNFKKNSFNPSLILVRVTWPAWPDIANLYGS